MAQNMIEVLKAELPKKIFDKQKIIRIGEEILEAFRRGAYEAAISVTNIWQF